MTDLETSLRAALGIPDTDEDTFQQDNPNAPLALNDDNGLRDIIMGEIQQQAANQQAQEGARRLIQAINTNGNN